MEIEAAMAAYEAETPYDPERDLITAALAAISDGESGYATINKETKRAFNPHLGETDEFISFENAKLALWATCKGLNIYDSSLQEEPNPEVTNHSTPPTPCAPTTPNPNPNPDVFLSLSRFSLRYLAPSSHSMLTLLKK